MRQIEHSKAYSIILMNLTPAQRWDAARRLYWSARELRAAVLRAEHPEWDEQMIEDEVRGLFMHARD